MKVEASETRTLLITDVPDLDPVTVFLQDLGPGRGRIVVECYGKSWASYFNATGTATLAEFIARGNVDYLTNALIREPRHTMLEKAKARQETYLGRIVTAVIEAARIFTPAAAWASQKDRTGEVKVL